VQATNRHGKARAAAAGVTLPGRGTRGLPGVPALMDRPVDLPGVPAMTDRPADLLEVPATPDWPAAHCQDRPASRGGGAASLSWGFLAMLISRGSC
jgi:hypothetical protein